MPSEKSVLHPQTLVAQGLGRVAIPYRDIVPPIHVATTYERGADGILSGRALLFARRQSELRSGRGAGRVTRRCCGSHAVRVGAGGSGGALPVACARRSRARAAQHVLGAAQMVARVCRAVGARDRVLRKCIDRRSRREGARGAAEPHLDRDAGEPHVGRHRHRRGVRDRARGRRDRRRRFDGGNADADASARARRARGHALGDQVPERPFRRDRGRARGRARRRAVAAHSLHPRSAAARCSGRWKRGCCCAACARSRCGSRRRARTRPRSPRDSTAMPKLSHVLYPGLPTHPNHAVAAAQMRGGFGGMMSLRFAGGEEAAKAFTARREGIQASDIARLGRELRRASRERRGSGNAVSAGPRAAVDRHRARRRPDRRTSNRRSRKATGSVALRSP